MKKTSVVLVFLASISCLMAHEFWLSASSFFLSVGQTTHISAMVGEDFAGKLWKFDPKRIKTLRHYTKNTMRDLDQSTLPADSLLVRFDREGNQLIALETNNKFLAMEADKFLAYLKEDGLDNAIALRQQRNETKKQSREFYARCVKTLVQVGASTDRTYAIQTNMTLEIVPQQNPYEIAKNGQISYQVLFKKQPLGNAYVRLWNKNAGKLTTESARSDTSGRVSLPQKTGINMVSVVTMVPTNDPTTADWQSYWGSLTFAVR